MITKTTLKQLKQILKYSETATDITRYNFDQVNELRERETGLYLQMLSTGVYGINGALLQGKKTGISYIITARTGSLFQLV